MNAGALTQFLTLTIGLFLGLGVVLSTAFRANISANWDANRCDPYVQPIAGWFKPLKDPRTAAEFARDNWKFCQKEYVQNAIRLAAAVPKELAEAEAGTVGLVSDVVSVMADVFFDLWQFCYEAYSGFMDRMKTVAKLFHNFMINLHSIVGRLQAATLSIVFGLISLIKAFISGVQVALIVAIVIVGILIALQIILFFLLLPISGLIITVTAIISVTVVLIATAIAAAMVAELFTPGACFAAGTQVMVLGGTVASIETIKVGTQLADGGRVTAIHQFWSRDEFYNIDGVHVTGDHLVTNPNKPRELMAVKDYPGAQRVPMSFWTAVRNSGAQEMWCLTTTTRRIPCRGATAGALMFADWEEIAEDDTESLLTWYSQVWKTLNGATVDVEYPKREVLDAEAGLSPDCLVACVDWWGQRVFRRISDIKVGDRVFDGPDTTTVVTGRVRLEGDQVTNAVELPGIVTGHGPQLVSWASWVLHMDGCWKPAADFTVRELHPSWWEHLYTESGTFMVAGGWCVRDASDVGLGNLRPLVESIVLGAH
jgi:hypothetical protein